MGLMGKILGKSDSQVVKEEVRKEADRQAKLNMTIAEQYGALASCRDTFERVIAMDRLNALERREKRIGDAAQKDPDSRCRRWSSCRRRAGAGASGCRSSR